MPWLLDNWDDTKMARPETGTMLLVGVLLTPLAPTSEAHPQLFSRSR